MPRDIDPKATRKAMRKLERAAKRAEAEGVELSDWEESFVTEVGERLEIYGSAFADLTKGNADDALSQRQTEALRRIDRKSRGKDAKTLQTRKPLQAKRGFASQKPSASRTREIEHFDPEPVIEPDASKPQHDENIPPKREDGARRPIFRVIEGGKRSDS